jgi:XTP/dITP diphosphohydrolase
MQIVIATNNQNKLKELKKIAPQYEWLSLKELGCDDEIKEDGNTFEENALIKAKFVAEKYNITCIADDSGLCVDALNGAPGVYSARYSGEKATDEENNIKLLYELQNISNRNARFVCVICLYDINKKEGLYFRGEIEGEILNENKGNMGFGYDPLFKSIYHEKSFAEVSMEEKNKVSHRAIAIQKLQNYLNNH